MKTKQIKIYEFKELSKAAQEKAIENNYYINTEFDDWHDFKTEYHAEQLEQVGFTGAKISFSGFAFQGDGASFESGVNIEKIINTLIMCDIPTKENSFKYVKLLRLIDLDMLYLDFSIDRISNQYCHENTCTTNLGMDLYLENCSASGENFFDNILSDLEGDIEHLRYQICQEIYYDLRKQYEHLSSKESIKDALISNEIEFLEDGTTY